MDKKTNIYTKLQKVQSELKAPKGQFNSFGKYNYRSCEDILEALKPLLNENNLILTITDRVELIGDRYYLIATAKLIDPEDGQSIETQAMAREDESKKGMDLAQVTGSVSSYARKYALNGLFCIDDTKDSDATNTHGKGQEKSSGAKGKPTTSSDSTDYKCSDCGAGITSGAYTFSTSKFKRPLCMNCQKKVG